MKQMKLVIPKLQQSLNVLLRMHHRVFHREQDVFDALVLLEARQKYGKCNMKGKKVKVTHTLFFGDDYRKRDYSNFAQKMIDDSMVKAGLIDDDCSKVIVEEVVRIRCDKDNPRTETEIEEVIF